MDERSEFIFFPEKVEINEMITKWKKYNQEVKSLKLPFPCLPIKIPLDEED